MTATLRPMNLGEIFDRSLQIYRKQFWALAIVGAVPALIVQGVALADAYWFHLYALAVHDNHWTPGIYMTQGVFQIGYYHFSSFFSLLLFPVILKQVSGLVLGEHIKFREAWQFFSARWLAYLGLAALQFLAALVLVEAITIALFAATMGLIDAFGPQSLLESSPTLIIVCSWFAAGFAAFLWLTSSLSLAIPSAALENLKPLRALRRSWTLTRGSRLRIALAWIALAVGAWIFSVAFHWGLRIVVVAVVRSTHARWIAYSLYPILSRTLVTVLAAVFGPIYPIALTLFYYDQRIRREGYDIERMMQQAGMEVTEDSLAVGTTVPPLNPYPQIPDQPPPGVPA